MDTSLVSFGCDRSPWTHHHQQGSDHQVGSHSDKEGTAGVVHRAGAAQAHPLRQYEISFGDKMTTTSLKSIVRADLADRMHVLLFLAHPDLKPSDVLFL